MEEELATEFVYVLTTFPMMYVAAVQEELLCEYEARNPGHALALLYVLLLQGNHDGKLSPLIVVGRKLFVDCSLL